MEKFNLYFRIKTKILREVASFFNYRPDSYPFITGDGFRKAALHVYDETGKLNPKKVKEGDIIFVASPFIHEYFNTIHPKIDSPYKLITHNGDNEVGEAESKYIDEKIVRWFAQNNTFRHPKITPIPIGLENRKWFMSGYVLYKNYKKIKTQTIIKKDRILYGFNVGTNPTERSIALSELKNNPIADEIVNKLSPKAYFELLNQYKYVASPPGNGLDCHRTWEALYLGVIPIVKESECMKYFKELGLSIEIVTGYNKTFKGSKTLKSHTEQILNIDYWINKIQ